MKEWKECCGNCSYCQWQDGEWICTNEKSDGYACETSFDDYCEEWEIRDAN